MSTERVIGRFAPTPSGRLHLGNAYAYLIAWLSARSAGGEIVLRMEDLDTLRCTEAFAESIREDLLWLGLTWDRESPPQRARTAAYEEAVECLREHGNVFPCWCTRGSLNLINAPHATDGHPIHPAACRLRSEADRAKETKPPALRLEAPDLTVSFTDGLYGPQSENLKRDCGDFVLRRADGVFVYQLAVVVDDIAAGVTEVVRGSDLLGSTGRQIYLYRLLGAEPPEYLHLPLLTDGEGRRLAKRDADTDLGLLRQRMRPEELLGRLAALSGLIDRPEPVSAEELSAEFDRSRLPRENLSVAGFFQ